MKFILVLPRHLARFDFLLHDHVVALAPYEEVQGRVEEELTHHAATTCFQRHSCGAFETVRKNIEVTRE